MKRIGIAAIGAAMTLGACSSPDVTSRLDNRDTLFSGFESAENYAPSPVGSRSDNDFLRFSTSAIQ